MKLETLFVKLETGPRSGRGLRAFTLIELLVVIAIMAILAALLIPAGAAMNKRKKILRTKTELQQTAEAIEYYKSKLNFYPPAGTNDPRITPLYYELKGSRLDINNPVFATLDGVASVKQSDLPDIFGVGGFANMSRGTGVTEEGHNPQNFLRSGLRSGQALEVEITTPSGNKNAWVLGTSVEGPAAEMLTTPPSAPTKIQINPWRYDPNFHTNNPVSFDLWVDILIGSKTNRICNWSTKPIPL